MNTITSIFDQALLTEAAYANFWDAQLSQTLTLPIDVKAALEAEGFSDVQASDFVTHWKVVDHIPDTDSGFSATVFERIDGPDKGQRYLEKGTDLFLLNSHPSMFPSAYA